MIYAILEISVLLIISALIGLVFTWLFWRKKYRALITDLFHVKTELDTNKKNLAAINDQLKDSKNALSQKENLLKEQNNKIQKKEKELSEQKDNLSKAEATTRNEKQKVKQLTDEVEILKEELEEKERELEVLSKELSARKISYYKQIDGKRYKAATLKMADESVSGQGDGRISMNDAKMIFDTISDGKAYTHVEKETMRYLRDNYKWTEEADKLFRKKVRSWAAKGHDLN